MSQRKDSAFTVDKSGFAVHTSGWEFSKDGKKAFLGEEYEVQRSEGGGTTIKSSVQVGIYNKPSMKFDSKGACVTPSDMSTELVNGLMPAFEKVYSGFAKAAKAFDAEFGPKKQVAAAAPVQPAKGDAMAKQLNERFQAIRDAIMTDHRVSGKVNLGDDPLTQQPVKSQGALPPKLPQIKPQPVKPPQGTPQPGKQLQAKLPQIKPQPVKPQGTPQPVKQTTLPPIKRQQGKTSPNKLLPSH